MIISIEKKFESDSFDFLFCQAAFKYFTQPVKAIEEMYRVLRFGGTAILLDLRSDVSQTEIDWEIENMQLGRIDAFLTRWTFHNFLLKNAYSVRDKKTMASQTPFSDCEVRTEGIGFEASLKKR